ncbi:hypothetical protein ABAC460_17185 [Asticcacaulis sp. AC460]|nr:hypothetical protein ABAC460_17185 [Asticcacaulis sp. AC460]
MSKHICFNIMENARPNYLGLRMVLMEAAFQSSRLTEQHHYQGPMLQYAML